MSYFKGQDGGRSQVTSFYQSAPQTSKLLSRARQKGALLHSTGKLPHQSYIPLKHKLNCLPALAPDPHHMVKIHCCLIACESSLPLPRKWKRVPIMLIAIDLLKNTVLWTSMLERDYTPFNKKTGFKEQLLNWASISNWSYDVELESQSRHCSWWIYQHLGYERG